MKYIDKRTPIIEGYRWTGRRHIPESFAKNVQYSGRRIAKIPVLGGYLKPNIGDWIIKKSDGDLQVISHESFLATYILLMPEPVISNPVFRTLKCLDTQADSVSELITRRFPGTRPDKNSYRKANISIKYHLKILEDMGLIYCLFYNGKLHISRSPEGEKYVNSETNRSSDPEKKMG